jgi:cytochrome c oxidase subunit III
VTVVLSWAALKLNNFARYRKFQAVTILCALAFIGIKSVEYKDKFTHYEVWLADGKRMTGHIEGSPWFWNLDTLRKKQLSEISFHPDPKHYAEKPAAGDHAHDAAAEGHAAGHEAIKIPTANIKRLSAFVPAHGTYFAIYFTLTALHALHVLGGALVIAYIWGPGAKMWKTDPERYINRVEISGLFWHFVDLVWIFLFPVLYLL